MEKIAKYQPTIGTKVLIEETCKQIPLYKDELNKNKNLQENNDKNLQENMHNAFKMYLSILIDCAKNEFILNTQNYETIIDKYSDSQEEIKSLNLSIRKVIDSKCKSEKEKYMFVFNSLKEFYTKHLDKKQELISIIDDSKLINFHIPSQNVISNILSLLRILINVVPELKPEVLMNKKTQDEIDQELEVSSDNMSTIIEQYTPDSNVVHKDDDNEEILNDISAGKSIAKNLGKEIYSIFSYISTAALRAGIVIRDEKDQENLSRIIAPLLYFIRDVYLLIQDDEWDKLEEILRFDGINPILKKFNIETINVSIKGLKSDKKIALNLIVIFAAVIKILFNSMQDQGIFGDKKVFSDNINKEVNSLIKTLPKTANNKLLTIAND